MNQEEWERCKELLDSYQEAVVEEEEAASIAAGFARDLEDEFGIIDPAGFKLVAPEGE